MNVDTDLKIEQTTYPQTGETEYRIKMRVSVQKFDFKKMRFENVEMWVEHPLVEDEHECLIWSDSSTCFKTLDSAKASLDTLINHYLRKESIKTIL